MGVEELTILGIYEILFPNFWLIMDKSPEKLRKKKRIEKKEKTDEVKPWIDTRRQKIRNTLMGVLAIAGIGGAVILALREDQNQKVPHGASTSVPAQKTHTTSMEEQHNVEKIDKLIPAIEKGFQTLASTLQSKLHDEKDQEFVDDLMAPIKVVQGNSVSQEKNAAKVLKGEIPVPTFEESQKIIKQTPNLFYYDVFPRSQQRDFSEASYSSPWRVIHLREDFDTGNMVDLLVLYHELCHVLNDNAQREVMNTPEKYEYYMKFLLHDPEKEKRRIDILDEGIAYGHEIEAMNVLLDGQLKKDIERGVLPNADEVAHKFHARQDQIGLLKNLFVTARAYYLGGGKMGFAPKIFMDKIKNFSDPGAVFYVPKGSEYLQYK